MEFVRRCIVCGLSFKEAALEMNRPLLGVKGLMAPEKCSNKMFTSPNYNSCMLKQESVPVTPGTWFHDRYSSERANWSQSVLDKTELKGPFTYRDEGL